MPSQEDATPQEHQCENDPPKSGDGSGINAKSKPEGGTAIDGEEGCDDSCEKTGGGQSKIYNKLEKLSQSITVTDWIVALCTIVITIATVFNVKLVGEQLNEMRSSSEQSEALVKAAITQAAAAKALAELTSQNQAFSQRARIAPSGAQIGGEISKGLPIKINVSFVNYGIEGAEDFNFSVKGFFGDSKLWSRGGYDEKLSGLKGECMGRDTFDPGMTIFPVQVSSKKIPVDLADGEIPEGDKIYWSQRAISGDDIVVVTGCFTYRTVNIRRHTFFCYYANVAELHGDALGNCRAGHAAD